jgi:Transcriptional regulator, AbiEi antitoxin
MGEQLPEPLARLITRQRGVVTSRQLAEADMSTEALRWRVARGHWQRMQRGVYATFSGQPDRLAILWAAVLCAGPGAMLSHETAAELAKLIDKPARLIHITIPAERRVTAPSGIVIHRSDRASRAGDPRALPPQTRIEETVLDLAGAARSLDDACGWVLRASQRRLIAPAFLAHGLTQRDRIRWRPQLTELLTPDIDGLHSVLELRYHRDVEQPHHLPAGTRQAAARNQGRSIYRDILYEPYATAVELDGDAFHLADTRWRDIQRDNAAAADGIITLRYGWLDITLRPCQVAAEIARVLARRGYTAAWPCSPDCPLSRS